MIQVQENKHIALHDFSSSISYAVDSMPCTEWTNLEMSTTLSDIVKSLLSKLTFGYMGVGQNQATWVDTKWTEQNGLPKEVNLWFGDPGAMTHNHIGLKQLRAITLHHSRPTPAAWRPVSSPNPSAWVVGSPTWSARVTSESRASLSSSWRSVGEAGVHHSMGWGAKQTVQGIHRTKHSKEWVLVGGVVVGVYIYYVIYI